MFREKTCYIGLKTNYKIIKETLSNKHFLFRFLIFLLQQVHITIQITKMQKQMGVTELLFELQLIENWQAQYLV